MLTFIKYAPLKLLSILLSLKRLIGDDLQYLNVPFDDSRIDCIYITRFQTNENADELVRLLWKWKYTGFNLDDLINPNYIIHYTFKGQKYELHYNKQDQKYFFRCDHNNISKVCDVLFNQIEFVYH